MRSLPITASASSCVIAPPCTNWSIMSLPLSSVSKIRSASFLTVSAPKRPRITVSMTSSSTTPSKNSAMVGSTNPSPMVSSSSAICCSASAACACSCLRVSASLWISASNDCSEKSLALLRLCPARVVCWIASLRSQRACQSLERSWWSRSMEGVAWTMKRVMLMVSSHFSALTCLLAKQRKGGSVRNSSFVQATSLPPVATQPVNSSKAWVSVSVSLWAGMERKCLLVASSLRG
mmetsp:Transcript_120479/g.341374  ORF Transcript_120479/g.341374 Transcript_120479/m.341374 type:complete len:235 (-) Transcript_120479:332-1036(-)